jgi:hypothetical protein
MKIILLLIILITIILIFNKKNENFSGNLTNNIKIDYYEISPYYIKLFWNNVDSYQLFNTTDYYVKISTDINFIENLIDISTNFNKLTIENLIPNTNYYCKINSITNLDNKKETSGVFEFKTLNIRTKNELENSIIYNQNHPYQLLKNGYKSLIENKNIEINKELNGFYILEKPNDLNFIVKLYGSNYNNVKRKGPVKRWEYIATENMLNLDFQNLNNDDNWYDKNNINLNIENKKNYTMYFLVTDRFQDTIVEIPKNTNKTIYKISKIKTLINGNLPELITNQNDNTFLIKLFSEDFKKYKYIQTKKEDFNVILPGNLTQIFNFSENIYKIYVDGILHLLDTNSVIILSNPINLSFNNIYNEGNIEFPITANEYFINNFNDSTEIIQNNNLVLKFNNYNLPIELNKEYNFNSNVETEYSFTYVPNKKISICVNDKPFDIITSRTEKLNLNKISFDCGINNESEEESVEDKKNEFEEIKEMVIKNFLSKFSNDTYAFVNESTFRSDHYFKYIDMGQYRDVPEYNYKEYLDKYIRESKFLIGIRYNEKIDQSGYFNIYNWDEKNPSDKFFLITDLSFNTKILYVPSNRSLVTQEKLYSIEFAKTKEFTDLAAQSIIKANLQIRDNLDIQEIPLELYLETGRKYIFNSPTKIEYKNLNNEPKIIKYKLFSNKNKNKYSIIFPKQSNIIINVMEIILYKYDYYRNNFAGFDLLGKIKEYDIGGSEFGKSINKTKDNLNTMLPILMTKNYYSFINEKINEKNIFNLSYYKLNEDQIKNSIEKKKDEIKKIINNDDKIIEINKYFEDDSFYNKRWIVLTINLSIILLVLGGLTFYYYKKNKK